ncbi:MAG: sugar ABC transporter ATP-binding protein [Solirubrobacterales bacterium]
MEAREVTKRFGGQLALDAATLAVQPGSVHALAGENGAGKSTLIKILAGVHQPDAGYFAIDGRRVDLRNPHQVRGFGISFVHQDLYLAADMSVRENVILGSGYPTRRGTAIRWRTLTAETKRLLDLVGLDVDPTTPVRDLNPAHQQLVALARAMRHDPRIIVLDEPTAALGDADSNHLLDLVQRRKEEGVTSILVSHRLDEILRVADAVTILRDGKVVTTVPRATLTRADLVRLLGGHPDGDESVRTGVRKHASVRVSVDGLHGAGLDVPATFTIGHGEVVALAGLVGSGRSSTAHLISGLSPASAGAVTVDGRAVPSGDLRAAIEHGIVLVPSERKNALVSSFTVAENFSLGHIERYARRGLVLDKQREANAAERFVDELEIRRRSPRSPVRDLSGGNQQKVLLARALDLEPKCLILDEPTSGIDIATKEYIYGLVRRLAAAGTGVLFISSDLEELPLVADRILVFNRGRITRELPGDASRPQIVHALFSDQE